MKYLRISLFTFLLFSGCSNKTAEQYYQEGIEEGKNGNAHKAYKLFSKAINKQRNYADAYAYRAFYGLEPQDKMKEAFKDYNKAYELAQDNQTKAFALNNRGRLYLQQKDTKKAIIDIKEAMKLLPEEPLHYKNAALVMLEINNIDAFCGYMKLALEKGYTKKYGPDAKELYQSNCILK